MNNFNRSTAKSAHYQPPMKKRGVNNLEDIEENKSISESAQSVQPHETQPPCPPQQAPQPPQNPPHRPPQQSPQPPHRPGQPPHGHPPYRPPQRPSNRPQQPQKPPKGSNAIGSEQLDNLVNTASRHLNTSPEELKNAAQSGNMQKLFSQMSPSQAQQLQKILSDENAAKKLLSTPQAQALLRGLSKNE